ncbi:flagellar hook-basal body complex protein FliE [Modestobacter sp. I12A-02628]|uniref:Flagellar hook-basal body complex protein FliE n=1 Tax=Goekera deserti TaxID=2497753 RepID=A0A7K3WGA6_9ACTN|nr:flagellar hook-basal body complex protein FliE [Goekera deserti]MPQ99502.1 flagellar hook-basal body complex protein FliE [Goekera deserti]NDI48989.1 flagellar hook-basal body complex protein FliE [Goekera deserti]NEL55541.1 flagellar hook-basal body complex protein FliE [Goekera deserti]
MTSAISGLTFPAMPAIGAVGGPDATSAAAGTPSTTASGASFADVLTSQVDRLNAVQGKADTLAAQAATGDLQDAHDYQIAATQAQLTTEMVVSLRNKGVEAFNDIMRMQI